MATKRLGNLTQPNQKRAAWALAMHVAWCTAAGTYGNPTRLTPIGPGRVHVHTHAPAPEHPACPLGRALPLDARRRGGTRISVTYRRAVCIIYH